MNERFTDAEDDENLIFRKVRGDIEIGICPMLYSFRIRAGVIGDGYVYVDYDAGKDVKDIEMVYGLVLSIISKRMDEMEKGLHKREMAHRVFKDFPIQERKPMTLDPDCFNKLDEMCGPEIISIYRLNIKEEIQKRKIQWAITTEDKMKPDFIAMLARMGFFDDLLSSN